MESSARRILGDKDVNALLSPTRHASSKTSDVKAPNSVDTYARGLSPMLDSKKRSLDAADIAASVTSGASTEHATKRAKAIPSELPPVERSAEHNVAESEETSSQAVTVAESASGPSLAEQLRLRLRIAMFKVKTDQAAAPMSRLEIAPPVHIDQSITRPEICIKDPPEALMRRYRHRSSRSYHDKWQRIPASGQRTVELGPALSYAPHDALLPVHPDQETSRSSRYVRSSSPPCSDCEDHVGLGSEDVGEPATPTSAMMTESSGSPRPLDALPTPHLRRPLEQDLTSSAIKGNAADSLLRLGGGSV